MKTEKTENEKIELMAHFIAGYPSLEESREIARALIRGGADYLEMQIPFSDPSADGPVIEAACAEALAKGFTLSRGWKLLKSLTGQGTPVYVMSYANPVFTFGVEPFLRKIRECGAAGIIVPDLVPGHDEELFSLGRSLGLDVIPVAAPSLTEERRQIILDEKPRWIYAALRRGITGTPTAMTQGLDPASLSYLKSLQEKGAQIIAGFGLREASQLKALEGVVRCAVAGSFFVEAAKTGPGEVEKRIRSLRSC